MRDGRMQNRQNPTRPTNTNANRDARMQPTHRKPENWLKSQLRRRPLPVWVLIVTDILLIGISLLVFAYFHHVRPKEVAAVGISSSREAMAAYAQVPAATELPQVLDGANAVAIAPTATPQSDPVGYFGTKYADKFTDGDVIRDGLSYKSEYLNITIHENFEYNSKIYVCDFYVKDISCLRTEFGKEKYGQNINEALSHMTARVGSISSINGDYYSLREDGAIIRNGVLYRDDEYTECDMCVLYWDGTMKTFEPGQFDAIAQMEAVHTRAGRLDRACWMMKAIPRRNSMPRKRCRKRIRARPSAISSRGITASSLWMGARMIPWASPLRILRSIWLRWAVRRRTIWMAARPRRCTGALPM